MTKNSILYFDCASGISGDMVLGALLDLGADEQKFLTQLQKLSVEGWSVQTGETQKNGIRAKRVKVCVEGAPEYPQGHGEVDAQDMHAHTHGEPHHAHEGHAHGTGEPHEEHAHEAWEARAHEAMEVHHTHEGHEHGTGEPHGEHAHGTGEPHAHEGHAHPHRTFADIRRILEASSLSDDVKDLSLRIFRRVAEAEAKVHGSTADEVHFHEVGAVDSIVDIVGCAILICELKPEAILSSAVHEGHGFVHCQHGMLPVPVPATSEILAAAGASLAQIDIEGELATPTGAAILAELAASYGPMPPMRITKIGWGAGTKDLPIPNVLKVYQGYPADPQERREPNGSGEDLCHDEIVVMEANLDDCTGEMLGRAMELLLEAGALDVFYTPVFMKKNRPAYRLTVLARPGDEDRLERLIFRHTTTIGIRRRREERSVLPRKTESVQTPYGKLEVKKVFMDGAWRAYPEYQSAVELAEQNNLSLWEIYKSYE